MKYFLAFQKKKAIPVPEGAANNEELVGQLNHELMQYGFILDKLVTTKLSKCSVDDLDIIYHDLLEGIKTVIPGGGFEEIYKGFPKSVKKLQEEINEAVQNYTSNGSWNPIDEKLIFKTFSIEPIDYKVITFMSKEQFKNIFENILYSNNSISKFDKAIAEWFIFNDYKFDIKKINFKETLAYIGQKLLDAPVDILPINNATDILRIWSAYSGGDEGLKENTKFKNPSSKQRTLLLNTLNSCYNLEESFKANREKWLRFLFYLHPMAKRNKELYPEVAKFTDTLRNKPKTLKTFNSKVEGAIVTKDIKIFDLLKKRMGAFSRRLDHLTRVFGFIAIGNWLSNSPSLKQMIEVFNHLYGRDKEQTGRSAILASQASSSVVTYKSLKPLPIEVVKEARLKILNTLISKMKNTLGDIYVAPSLYLKPLSMNNRASSLSINNSVIGTVEKIPLDKVIRIYCMWEGSSDIDLSGLIINKDNTIEKVGWDSSFDSNGVTYSGDNTGNYNKNAEYLDIDSKNISSNTEWVIIETRIYSGELRFSDYPTPPLIGWMLRDKPNANLNWLPSSVKQAVTINNDAENAYLAAFHVPSNSIVYLDVAMNENAVSTKADALQMRIFLNKFIPNLENNSKINWDIINQGHILSLLATNVVEREEASIIFDENTTLEEITKFI